MTKKILVVIASIILFFNLCAFQKKEQRVYVPNELTAIKIAEAVWLPIYGNNIYDSKPFIATLQGDSLWIVTGTASKSYKEIIDGDTVLHLSHHGVPYIEIRKCDGRIIIVSHSK